MTKIDITPSWRFIVKGFLQVLKSHSKKSLSDADFWTIRTELLKCSNLADLYNEEAEKERQFQYNGWTNKVTHTIMSQIDNDEMMRNCFMNDAVDMDLNNITLGQYIKEHFYGLKPELDHYNESMLSWAYGMVNWEEIAEHILDAVAEENEPEEDNTQCPMLLPNEEYDDIRAEHPDVKIVCGEAEIGQCDYCGSTTSKETE